jgi:superfamily II DNA or RNA helicase
MTSDPRRRFSSKQRVALYLAADGRCEQCGTQLEAGWHADHVHPYSKGGDTDVINGAALCPPCNLKKGNNMPPSTTDPRTVWQQQAVSKFLGSNRDFLVTAFPGTGKTRFTLEAVKSALHERKEFDFVIIVVPTSALRYQWNEAAAQYGLDITATFKSSNGRPPKDVNGIAVTYQAVDRDAQFYRHLTGLQRTLVVFDEVHHVGEHRSWGRNIPTAFEPSARKLMLSGTPFRVDRQPIPFVTYGPDGFAQSDYDLPYKYALQNKMVRAIKFVRHDGVARATTERGYAIVDNESLSEVEAERISTAWSALCDPDGDWVPELLAEANDELDAKRKMMPDAAGLIHARSKYHAGRYAEMLTRICGEKVDVVHDDIPEAHQIIKRFASSGRRWLVAVNMVSEGVDIPRAAVSVYLSDRIINPEMYFIQVLARIIRKLNGDDRIEATMFIPEIASITKIAEAIERDVAAVAIAQEEAERRDLEARDDIVTPDRAQLFYDSSAPIDTGVTYRGENYDAEQLRRAEMVLANHPELLSAGLNSMHLLSLTKEMQQATTAAVDAQHNTTLRQNPDETRKRLNKEFRACVGRIHRNTNDEFPKIYREIYDELDLEDNFKLAQADVPLLEELIRVAADLEERDAWSSL